MKPLPDYAHPAIPRFSWALPRAVCLAFCMAACTPSDPAPIRIGVVHALTGTLAISGTPLVDAIRLAVEEINRQGGLLGRPVALSVADDRSDDNIAAAETKRLIEQERVSVLFACWTSSCRKAVKPVVEGHRHLMFHSVQYEGLESSPNLYYTGAVPNQQIIPGIRWAETHLGRRWYLIGSDYLFPPHGERHHR